MAKRELQEINAGSMADIAFLLLIFFLVTTTMDRDIGLLRQLPPPLDEQTTPPVVKERNVFVVLANAKDQLLVEGEETEVEELKDKAREFFTNPTNNVNLPERKWVRRGVIEQNLQVAKANFAKDPKNKEAKKSVKKWQNKLTAIELLGEYKELPSSAVVSLQNDRGTSYDLYIRVQNELSAAINELRDELSVEKFGVKYEKLDDKNEDDKKKIVAIRSVYPQRISEAEPKNLQ